MIGVKEENYQRDIFKAASIPDKEGWYTIGPFGRRVSFASQQQRALSTVWALHTKGVTGPSKRVAVIGGGVAGLMAAVTLVATGSRVHLFDKANTFCHLQAAATHRWVHPNLLFWPIESLELTTDLPYWPAPEG